MNTATATRHTLRFPLKRDRKSKAMMPPKDDSLHGAPACIAGMVRAAIGRRALAEEQLRKAAICADLGDHRAAHIARIEARRLRRTMRSHALWARVFADQVRDNDARLEQISSELTRELSASFRSSNLSERWRRVQLLKFNRGLTEAARQRIDAVLHRIALKHDALNPYGHTLAHHTEGQVAA